MTAEILIGCAGYSYDDWGGAFYPPDLPAAKRLEFYSKFFALVEVNFTFYQMPSRSSFKSARERTGGRTLFNVKLHGDFTHNRAIVEGAAAQFIKAVKPLIDDGAFGCLLAQFPFSFRLNNESLKWIDNLGQLFSPLPIAVEFRNAEWADESVRKFLEERGMIFCIVDEPDLRGLMPPVTWVTSDTAYIRFHGRNSSMWWEHPDPAQRYNYLYSDDELAEWVKKIIKIREECEKLYVIMNNHFSGNAVRNARTLQTLLGFDIPPLEDFRKGEQGMLF